MQQTEQIIDNVAARTGWSRDAVCDAVNVILEVIREAVTAAVADGSAAGGAVHLEGFGTFGASSQARVLVRDASGRHVVDDRGGFVYYPGGGYTPWFRPAQEFAAAARQADRPVTA
ncbi:HU family DNA-binding protein [Planobispora siamensis]|uniref:HU family DNA-binding protein n=1 Tax=Planobispora siamensis TaxID=936338 RepID=A0A8J3SMR6_9ACTN|nr:HU family DNA-binding protein [Planobispora siamensis]GIH95275.1 hypothetical protein Psi01_59050 [Planobispora siamensis]